MGQDVVGFMENHRRSHQVRKSVQLWMRSFEQIPPNVTLSLGLYYTLCAYADCVTSTVIALLPASTDMANKSYLGGDKTARTTLHPDFPKLRLWDADLTVKVSCYRVQGFGVTDNAWQGVSPIRRGRRKKA